MYRYIIVDDEPLIRQGTMKKLEPLSDRISCAGEADNGAQAIELVKTLSPDFVILDMEMPVMDGTALLSYLSKNHPNLQLIVISGYKSFDYIKHAISANVIDYILKPFTAEQIQQTVCQAISRLETSASIDARIRLTEEEKEVACYEHDTQLLQNLILGYAVSDTDISSQKLSFLTRSDRLCLAVVYAGKSLTDFRLQQQINDFGFSEMAVYLPHPSNFRLGFFILALPNDASFSPKDFYIKFVQDFIAYLHTYDTVSYWGLSDTIAGLCHLHAAHEQACTSLNSMPVTQSSSQVYIWQPNMGTDLREISWEQKEEFLFRVEAGMTKEVGSLLLSLHTYYQETKSLSLADVKYHYHQLTQDCLLILKRYLHQSTPSQSMQNIVKEMFTIEELYQYYRQFFSNLSEMLKPQSVYAVEDTIEKIKIYIQRNYHKNLTVEFLASLFYMNSSYLSHLFRKTTGEKFAQYVNAVRIEKAKDLLASTDRKLYQIAKAVGYDNSKYFFRVFKKYEGMTPEQYRQAAQ
ncbi:response regulator [Faecalicatena acetigenes]|uniref:Stage 0 sporulation protein A homolog n=1 Tax=Faecalicatena acetigenes TaxID=2981790 RepID=A0ABT2TF38_9FIRM|nr:MULTISPECIES: response regulator [Lachnospiraceae]MCU6748422.1 response regulator [Faecalicatena acetigenes]SCI43231.1 Uncharacterized response regulatory protein SA0215 [uncultured Clostridium sp.]